MQQLLWFEVALKATAGLALFLIPLTVIRLAGLQRPDSGFWPRLVGGIVIGVAIAVYITLQFPDARGGLGPAGLIPINLTAAAALIAPLIMGTAAPSRRGKLFLFLTSVVLLTLSFLEIAHF